MCRPPSCPKTNGAHHGRKDLLVLSGSTGTVLQPRTLSTMLMMLTLTEPPGAGKDDRIISGITRHRPL